MPARDPFTQVCMQLARLAAPGRVDLHIHSTASDGAFTPAEVVERAVKAGLAAFAITDHDTLTGLAPARQALQRQNRAGIELIAGVEITTEADGHEIHLLGYGFRPDDDGLLTALDRLRQQRRGRFEGMVERLRNIGAKVEESVVSGILENEISPGRVHLARHLVQTGQARTVRHAFHRYLDDSGKVSLPKTRLPLAEAIAVVHSAGGVTSWAHPPLPVPLDRLHRYREFGLDALEAEYPRARRSLNAPVRALAQEMGLAITGGSDCHGPTPPRRAIGTWGITRKELDRLLARREQR